MSEEIKRRRRFEPLLIPEEASRLLVLSLLCLVAILPAAMRYFSGPATYRPTTHCAEGAVWQDERVRCSTQDSSLSPAEQFLLGAPIDLNTVDAETLRIIPGIGPKLSERIIAHRQENGPFATVEGVEAVKGIGPKLTEAIARYCRVR